ncbi:MAG: ribose 1,5-bisphosphate isomerase [Nitrososphaerales archaeon]|nr:ribose 1,5-bisphosphate isomerase [Nitrososphaerales archaeon]
MSGNAVESTYSLIKSMRVRGAGRIAREAVSALKQYCDGGRFSSADELYQGLLAAGARLKEARPTAVSLPNAINHVLSVASRNREKEVSLGSLIAGIDEACDNFMASSLGAVQAIGSIGAKRIVNGDTIMTHCNSEAVTAILSSAHNDGKRFGVLVTETRPRYQGRITASVLARKGLDVSLIPDSAARVYMRKVDKALVGADAIASNGAVVNKIGTAQIALIAHEARARFYVAAETYKLSPTTMLGELVEIENRSPYEVVPKSYLDANKKVKVKNPAFDVTPPEYIDLIITEQGVYPPQGIVLLMRELYPEPVSRLH